jgi:hypothetical protein
VLNANQAASLFDSQAIQLFQRIFLIREVLAEMFKVLRQLAVTST